jgi:serine/threonine protein kinase
MHFGAYELVGELDRDEVADEWLAVAIDGSGGVARIIRLLSPAATRIQNRIAFLRDARQAARVEHPLLLRVVDSSPTPDDAWAAIELVEGVGFGELLTLARRAHESLDPAVILRIALDIASALEALHANGRAGLTGSELVHGDVSPWAIQITPAGIALLTPPCLGTAVCHMGQPSRRALYKAPEQLTPGAAVDASADVFGFGATFWKALNADSQTDVPGPIADILLGALERERKNRPANATELRRALAGVEAVPAADRQTIARLVQRLGGDLLQRMHELAGMERPSSINYQSGTRQCSAPDISAEPRDTVVMEESELPPSQRSTRAHRAQDLIADLRSDTVPDVECSMPTVAVRIATPVPPVAARAVQPPEATSPSRSTMRLPRLVALGIVLMLTVLAYALYRLL